LRLLLYIWWIVAEADFTPGQYNATFIPGSTTATTSIPILGDKCNEDTEQFSLRLCIDDVAYEQCIYGGNISAATVFITDSPSGICLYLFTYLQVVCKINNLLIYVAST